MRLQICSLPCTPKDPYCKPLANFQLRLADRLLASPALLRDIPRSQLEYTCSPRGPGMLFNATLLKNLATADPYKVGVVA